MPSGQRRHVQEQDVFNIALENPGLNGGTDRNHLVRVHPFVRLPAEQFLHGLLHLRHAGLATDQDDFIDIGRLETGVPQGRPAGWNGFSIKSWTRASNFARVSLMLRCLGTVLISGNERQIDIRLSRA